MKKERETGIQEIVEKSIKGDARAFEALLRHYGSIILYRCIKLMGSRADGEDAAQEVLLGIHRSISGLREPAAFNVWMHRLIQRVCSRMKYNMAAGDMPLEEVGDVMRETKEDRIPEAYLVNVDKRDTLLEIVNALPARMRDVVLLYYYQDMTAKELADVFDTTENVINVTLYRARQKIKSALEQDDPGAYTMALLPFGAIAGLLQADVAQTAPAAAVAGCIRTAGFGRAPRPAVRQVLAAATPVVFAAAATVVVVLAVFGPGRQPAGEALPPAGTQEVLDPEREPLSSPGYAQSGPAHPAPGGQIAGRVYVDDPANPRGRTWAPLPGATVQLYAADGSGPLADAVAADGPDGFLLDGEGYEEFRVLVTLPAGARFAPAGDFGIVPVQGSAEKAWLAADGSEVLRPGQEDGALSGFAVAAYYPAVLSGRVAGGDDLGGLTVDLLDGDGTILAATTTGADGGYTFENPPVARGGTYTVALRFPLPGNLAPVGEQSVELVPGQDAALPLLEVRPLGSTSHVE